jgi:nicotinate-nucleotide--dimethylbenzimidazole phosphoribosyltransferase
MNTRTEGLNATLKRITGVDPNWIRQAELRQLQLTKPPGSLGRLEEVANRCAAIQQTLSPSVENPTILLFAADHGVCAEGVNAYPQAVTAQMVVNFLKQGAAINALARINEVELRVLDMGLVSELPEMAGLIRRRIAAGTRNFCREAAMSPKQALAAIGVGIEMAELALRQPCRLLGIGEMGIGNTTAASALTAAITGWPAETVVGRGAGADEACVARKVNAVERAIQLHRGHLDDPLDLLTHLGGFEIAAMCGVCLEGAARRCPIVVDGFIATVAAALAVKFHPSIADYLFSAHRSTEPGQAPLLKIIKQEPLLALQMRLGEGTGAALAIGLIRAAVEAFTGMATFESAGVENQGTP